MPASLGTTAYTDTGGTAHTWAEFSTLSCAGQGLLYASGPDGTIRWFQDLNCNGSPNWAPGSGNVIGNTDPTSNSSLVCADASPPFA